MTEDLKQKVDRIALLNRVQDIQKQKALLSFGESLKALSSSQQEFESKSTQINELLKLEKDSRKKANNIDPVQHEYYMQHLNRMTAELAESKAELDEKKDQHAAKSKKLAEETAKMKVYQRSHTSLKHELVFQNQKKEMMDLVVEKYKKGDALA